MNKKEIQLAQKLIAHPKWKHWMDGMGYVTYDAAEDDWCCLVRLDGYTPETMYVPEGAIPDLEDPATLGCLLFRLENATGNSISVDLGARGFYSVRVYTNKHESHPEDFETQGMTYGEALAEALLKAWDMDHVK